MRLIGMEKGGGDASIDFYDCPLNCEYCAHARQDGRDYDLMEVLEFLADPNVNNVYIGGAEPALQGRDLLELLQRLRRMKKRTILKTSGFYPDLIEDTIGLVHQYVLGVKCPLDDPEYNQILTGLNQERAGEYVENLERTMEILKGQNLKVWIRVIPGFLDEGKMERIGQQIKGVATEAWLFQFLSRPENEVSFRGIDRPGPDESEMVNLGRCLVKYVPYVYIMGEGFASEFKST